VSEIFDEGDGWLCSSDEGDRICSSEDELESDDITVQENKNSH